MYNHITNKLLLDKVVNGMTYPVTHYLHGECSELHAFLWLMV